MAVAAYSSTTVPALDAASISRACVAEFSPSRLSATLPFGCLLELPGPYVLVGHSLGGLRVRVFAHDYPADVAGVVLIESMSPKSARPGTGSAAPETDQPSRDDWLITLPARVGVLRVLSGPLGMKSGLSPSVADSYAALSVTPRYLQTYIIDEGQGMPASLAQAGAVESLGATPLIVLTSGLNNDADWQAMQTELLLISSNSQQMIADQSGHNV